MKKFLVAAVLSCLPMLACAQGAALAEAFLYYTPSGWSSIVSLGPFSLISWLSEQSGKLSSQYPKDYKVVVIDRTDIPNKGTVLTLAREPQTAARPENTYQLVLPTVPGQHFRAGDPVVVRLKARNAGELMTEDQRFGVAIPSQSFELSSISRAARP